MGTSPKDDGGLLSKIILFELQVLVIFLK